MDEMVVQDKPGFFSRVAGMLSRVDVYEDEFESPRELGGEGGVNVRPNYRYTVTVRRQITAFEDALAAANGLKRGEQQILNLSGTEPTVRQKIVDFMSGVNYAQEGTWEEIGENVYLVVPANAYVEMAPPTPRVNAIRN
jgi:cell division inhibitor SepF